MRIYFFLLVILLIYSCNQDNKIPKNIIERKQMQELLWDLARADAFLTGFAGKNDTAFNRTKETITLYRQVFQIHKTSKEKFKKSLEWYQQHPTIMKTILDTLQKRQRTIMQERSKPTTFPHIDSLRS